MHMKEDGNQLKQRTQETLQENGEALGNSPKDIALEDHGEENGKPSKHCEHRKTAMSERSKNVYQT
jgi:hypothetical protein